MESLKIGNALRPVRILVADDDPLMRSLVRANLEGRAGEISEASDGQEAWDLLLGERFELALIDLSMPGIDGFALIRCIRSHPRTRHLPVVVITSSSDQAAVTKAFDAGATSFLTKPINWTLFAHQIEYLIRMDQGISISRVTRQRAEAVARAKDAVIAALAARVRDQTQRIVDAAEAELLRSSSLSGRNLDLAAHVLADAHAIEEIIGEVLPYVRSMTEQIVVDDRSVPVTRLLEACSDRLRAMAAQGDVRISVAAVSPGARVRCDEAAMGRALANLVRNAVEFTRPGSCVEIRAEMKDDGALAITIDDEGPGADPAVIARCLMPLDLREGTALDTHEQAALGLPIAKAIAQAHGGTVEVVPRERIGTRASLILPPEIVEQQLDDAA